MVQQTSERKNTAVVFTNDNHLSVLPMPMKMKRRKRRTKTLKKRKKMMRTAKMMMLRKMKTTMKLLKIRTRMRAIAQPCCLYLQHRLHLSIKYYTEAKTTCSRS